MAINWRQEADSIISTNDILGDVDFILESDANEGNNSEIAPVLGGIDISKLTKKDHI